MMLRFHRSFTAMTERSPNTRSGHDPDIPALEGFHPAVAGWFQKKHGTPTDPQLKGWPAIREGRNTLIAAPTGSGKTLAAFLAAIDALVARAEKAELGEDIAETADAIKASLAKIEEQIIQTRSKSPQDPLNFPVMINDRIGAIANGVDGNYPPTAQSRQVFEYLSKLLDEQLEALDAILDTEIPTFNQMVRELEIPAVILDRID